LFFLAAKKGRGSQYLVDFVLNTSGFIIVHVNRAIVFFSDKNRYLTTMGNLLGSESVKQPLRALLSPREVRGKNLKRPMRDDFCDERFEKGSISITMAYDKRPNLFRFEAKW